MCSKGCCEVGTYIYGKNSTFWDDDDDDYVEEEDDDRVGYPIPSYTIPPSIMTSSSTSASTATTPKPRPEKSSSKD